MGGSETNKLRVVLLADAGSVSVRLRRLLEQHYDLVFTVDNWDPDRLDLANADVCMVELDSQAQQYLELFMRLLERSPVPVLFNVTHPDFGPQAEQALVAKLARLARERHDDDEPAAPVRSRPSLRVVETTTVPEQSRDPSRVWVLGASLGGPAALKRFFGALPPDFNDTAIIMQHIPAGHEAVFARQLGVAARREVVVARDGLGITPGQVLIVPVGYDFDISECGMIQLREKSGSATGYQPSIDRVFTAVVQRYGANTAGIIFSGMGEDGVDGMRRISEAGGVVWAQDATSCAVSTMPDAARKAGAVSFSGTPEQLAARLSELVGARQSASN